MVQALAAVAKVAAQAVKVAAKVAAKAGKAAARGASKGAKAAGRGAKRSAQRKAQGMAQNKLASQKGNDPNKIGSELGEAKNIAKDALAGNKLKASINAIKFAVKNWSCLLAGSIVSCTTIFFAAAMLLLLVAAPGGWLASTIGSVFSGDENENLCPVKTIEQDILDRIKKVPDPNNPDCYHNNLVAASQQTGVPQEIIASIDHMISVNKVDDSKNRLIQIGNEVQETNYLRDDDGNLRPDQDSNPVKNVVPDKKYTVGETSFIIKSYHCLKVAKKPVEWCFGSSSSEERHNFYTDPSGDGAKWLWDGYAEKGFTKDKLGAVAFYKQLKDGNGMVCTWEELYAQQTGDRGGRLGIGVPGQRDDKNIPILNDWKQGNWCGTAPWGEDFTTFDGGCCTMGSNGCGITSAAIVASWYGCAIDPGILNKAMNDAGSTSPFELAASLCGLSQRQIPGTQGVIDFLNSTHEPMVVNVTQTICGKDTLHFVAVAGFDGANYYVSDPGCCAAPFGETVAVSKAEFEGYMAGSPGTNTSFYKP